ncbi:hypothetical protein C1645_792451, partial [Glomus cerebriforme]
LIICIVAISHVLYFICLLLNFLFGLLANCALYLRNLFRFIFLVILVVLGNFVFIIY